MSLTRVLGASNRSSNKWSRVSAGSWLFRCIFAFPADPLFEETTRLMHRIFAVQKIARRGMEMLCGRLNGAPRADDGNQCVEGFLVHRLMRLWGSHDELKSETFIELN